MRKALDRQQRLDGQTVLNVHLNHDCRDEIIPILAALRHIYAQPGLRDSILRSIAGDLNGRSSRHLGRQGLDYWAILVLAAVRLGCNLNYDKLQDLAEQHQALRQIMGVGGWEVRPASTGDAFATTSRRSAPRPWNESINGSWPRDIV